MVHLLCILVTALPLNFPAAGDTASTDPFAMAKWEMFKRGTSAGTRHSAA